MENIEIEENTSQKLAKEKTTEIPPIMPTEGLDYKQVLTELKKIVDIDQFRIQYLKRNVKIFARHDTLRQAETPLFTYIRKQDKVKKIVFKGSPNLEILVILRELREAQIEPTESMQLKARNNKPSHSYLIIVPNHIQYK